MLTLDCWKNGYDRRAGLCYDSSADDYKAIIVVGGVVMVASFRSKHLGTIRSPSGLYNGKVMKPGPAVNQKLHWLLYDDNDGWNEMVLLVLFQPIKFTILIQ